MAKKKKRKRSLLRAILLPIAFLALIAGGVYYATDLLNSPKFVRYPAFGIDIPANYPIHGIDVSKHQGNIDWKAIKNMQVNEIRIGFAFIKATEGLNDVDNEFTRNWFHAKRALLPRGAYHFFIASKSGKAQAENFIEAVDLAKGDLPPVLDIETSNGSSVADIQQRAKDWLDMVEQHYKTRPIIYTNIDFYENFLKGKFDNYPLWVAHYLVQDKPRINRQWDFWQHNESGRVNGVDAFVDFNVFNGDTVAFRKLLMK